MKDLSLIVKEQVVEPLDHKNLNIDVPFLQGMMTSTENVVIQLWERLRQPILDAGGELAKIRLEETENNFVEYFGGKEPY